MLKNILIAIPILIIVLIVGRVIFVNLDQNKEFNYHESIPKKYKSMV